MAMTKKGGVNTVRPVLEKETKNGPKRLVRPASRMPAGAKQKRVTKRSR